MRNKHKPQKTLDIKVVAINFAIFLMIFYFAYHSLSGSRGLLAFFKLKNELTSQTKILNSLKVERDSLEMKVNMLNPDKLNEDYVDELARRELGMLARDEIMVNLDK